jgi:ribosome-binding protein aMBF1 (putative translation factor)
MAERTNEDIILKDKIADRIEFYRLKSGLSQADFAKAHNIDRQIIHRLYYAWNYFKGFF